ncbi:MAG: mannonate dehydratase [Pseudomonadota bacterium]
MIETWRWFGPPDTISLDEIVQTGVAGIVTALHHIPPGELWSRATIAKRKAEIEAAGLTWSVVESLPVSEDIKRQSGPWRAHLETYCQSLQHLAAEGIETICYNFMPVLDWTRTALDWPLPGGARTMRFDWTDFVVFDLHILNRPGAAYDGELREAAAARFATLDDAGRAALQNAIICGLPGGSARTTLEDLSEQIALYADVSADRLRSNHHAFVEAVAPEAERLGLRLCCHPDDPPFPLLGLPRVMSTEADYAALVAAVDLPANGITLCSGSLGARSDADLPGMMSRLGRHVHFLHLRNTTRDTPGVEGSFHESGHLQGDTDMVRLIEAILAEEVRRRMEGRADHAIPYRPDHGLHMLDDARRNGQPGYPLVGRLAGLSEIRGVVRTLGRTGAAA